PTTRSVTSAGRLIAARAQRRTLARDGKRARRAASCTSSASDGAFGMSALLLVRVDDALHERVAYHVLALEHGERDAAHLLQDAIRLHEAALLAALQVDLRHVPGDDDLAAEAHAREEHLHLLGRGVLRLVENDEGMVERAAAHVRERSELDRPALEQLADTVETEQVVERVVERPQVRIDLLREVARKKPQALARLDRGAHENDALDRVALEGIHGARDREVGLAGPRRADREGDVVLQDVLDVLALARRAAAQVAAAREQRRVLGLAAARVGAELDQSELHVVDGEPALRVAVEFLQGFGGARRLAGRAAHGEALAAPRDGHVERGLDLPQVLVERPAQVREPLVVERRQDHLEGFGLRGAHARSSRGAAQHAASIAPRRLCAIAAVMVASTNRPTRLASPGMLTTRLLAVRPASSPASWRDRPSTRMRWRVPSIASEIARACASSRPWSACRRSRLTCAGVSSTSSAAGVPGR